MVIYIIVVILAYCIGSINFSVILSRKMAGFDVREKGSKNAGTTNMLRTVGKKAALITLICDILKGIVAVLLALVIGKSFNIEILKYIAGFAVILGHTFPIFFEFRGGKGIATALGVLLILQWQVGLICLVFALILMALTKMVSVGSISAAILFPILVLFMEPDKNIWIIIISILILFYTIRVVSYGIYTFKSRNITGGISLIFLAAGTFSVFLMSLSYIFK